jgi:acyl-CoA dehydrogenase
LNFSAEDERFRDEVRAFLAAELDADLVAEARRASGMFVNRTIAETWQRKLNRRGWGAVAWPVEYGGTGWSPAQLFIFREECARAGAPSVLNQGVNLLAPALFAHGSAEQKAYYLPKMLAAEHYWCQGYSEPGSGSDLASLKTRAERDGDEYVVNGTKIWTTHAQYADHIFCLVRTSTDGRPQQGISFLLMEMSTPGIRVEPIITLAGDRSSAGCEPRWRREPGLDGGQTPARVRARQWWRRGRAAHCAGRAEAHCGQCARWRSADGGRPGLCRAPCGA